MVSSECFWFSQQPLEGMATHLVSLPDVERLSATVIRILGGNPGKVRKQRWMGAHTLQSASRDC